MANNNDRNKHSAALESFDDSISEKYLAGILSELSDPIHQRLIKAYGGQDPVKAMEKELQKILMEVLKSED